MNRLFADIDYLRGGNSRQRAAFRVLTENGILTKLKAFDPILVGTVPIEVDTEKSDLDIICSFTDRKSFKTKLEREFGAAGGFTIHESTSVQPPAMVGNFSVGGFEVEIFGQPIPTQMQLGYRHLVIEYHLLREYGDPLRQRVVQLKREGHKTEPAFAIALGLTGNPYEELLKFEVIAPD